jgi:hypothetical protein
MPEHFPDRFSLDVCRDGRKYVVTSTDPLELSAAGDSIASALWAWCQALAEAVERHETSTDVRVTWRPRHRRRP